MGAREQVEAEQGASDAEEESVEGGRGRGVARNFVVRCVVLCRFPFVNISLSTIDH